MLLMKDDPGYNHYEIGKGTYGNPTIETFSIPGLTLKVGSFTSIGGHVTILLGGEHFTNYVTTYPFDVALKHEYWEHPNNGSVVIGSDVWIGRGTTILDKVTIGDGAVIGAESLVCKDVQPYSIVAGNPARFIRFRFTPSQIQELLKIKWWNWPNNKIEESLPLLMSPNINEFIEKYKEKQL